SAHAHSRIAHTPCTLMRRHPPLTSHFPYPTLFRSVTGTWQRWDSSASISTPASMPCPRWLCRLVRLALSKEALKISWNPTSSARSEEHTSELQSRENLV